MENYNQLSRKPWRMEARSDKSLEIFLYDEIGSWSGGGISANAFVADLQQAGPLENIHLRVNSPGGNVFDGLAIYNSLLTHGAKVTAQIDGLCASIASLIVMAARRITMAANGQMMIHNPTSDAGGESKDHRRLADTMDQIRASMIKAYRRHSFLSAAEIGAMLDHETWMGAEQALANGFIEAIIDSEGELPIAASCLTQFRNVPAQIAARLQRKPEPSPDVYIPQFSGRTLAEIDAEHARLTLQHKLNQARYRQ
jgi:ATP-dependent Clp protease, protease subunit